uniref:Uncharacterized protein n=1 Tax=Steinernema glaseri TaxID=37863 RepID=A0A1I7XXB2_9BILA
MIRGTNIVIKTGRNTVHERRIEEPLQGVGDVVVLVVVVLVVVVLVVVVIVVVVLVVVVLVVVVLVVVLAPYPLDVWLILKSVGSTCT